MNVPYKEILIGILGVLLVIGIGMIVITQEKSKISFFIDFCKDKTGIYNITNGMFEFDTYVTKLNCSDRYNPTMGEIGRTD